MENARRKKEKANKPQSILWKKSTGIGIVLTLLLALYFRATKEPLKPSPIVTVSEGKLQGVVTYSRNGNEIYEYLSVPYAKKPIGDLRFEVWSFIICTIFCIYEQVNVIHQKFDFSLHNQQRSGTEFSKSIRLLQNAYKSI